MFKPEADEEDLKGQTKRKWMKNEGDRLCMKTTENSALQFVEESLQFVMNR